MHHTPVAHLKHHPDLRWVIVVTILITTAVVLFVYTMWDLTRPRPVLSLQVERQADYIGELQSNITQLNSINQSLQTEVKNKNEEIVALQTSLLAAQAMASANTTTVKTFPKN